MNLAAPDTIRTFDGETAVIADWHHGLGEETLDLNLDLLRRALLETYGIGWRLALFLYEIGRLAPAVPPTPG